MPIYFQIIGYSVVRLEYFNFNKVHIVSHTVYNIITCDMKSYHMTWHCIISKKICWLCSFWNAQMRRIEVIPGGLRDVCITTWNITLEIMTFFHWPIFAHSYRWYFYWVHISKSVFYIIGDRSMANSNNVLAHLFLDGKGLYQYWWCLWSN